MLLLAENVVSDVVTIVTSDVDAAMGKRVKLDGCGC
jgi:hypothetical protein